MKDSHRDYISKMKDFHSDTFFRRAKCLNKFFTEKNIHMVNKYEERYSIFLVMWEIKIKITMDY